MQIKQYLTTELLIRLFALIGILSCLASSVYFTDFLYYPLMGLSLAVGCVTLIKIFLLDRTVYRHRYFWPLFLFCVSYGMTILLNRHSGFFNNCGQLAYTACYFFILFCTFSQLRPEQRGRILHLLCRVVLVFALIVAVISFGMLLLNISKEVSFRGTTIQIGFHQRNSGMQLSGISSGSSSLSGLCIAGLASAWYILWEPVRLFTWRWFLSTLLLLLTLCAANAYSALIMALAFVAVYSICRNLRKKTQGENPGKKIGRATLEMILLCTLTVGCFYGVQKVEAVAVNSISHVVYQYELRQYQKEQSTQTPSEIPDSPIETPPSQPISSEGSPTEVPPSQPISSEEPSTEISPSQSTSPEQSLIETPPQSISPGAPPAEPTEVTIVRDVSTSATGVRSAIWKEGIKLFLAHPMGVTNSNISVKIFYGVPDYEYNNLHNGYLTLLVSSGILGFLLVMSFGILLLIRAMKSLYLCQNSQRRQMLCVAISLSAAILAGDLVNGCFVLWRGLPYMFLWLLLGSVDGMATEEEASFSHE